MIALIRAHWQRGLVAALAATLAGLLLASLRPSEYTATVEFFVLPQRIDSEAEGPYARKAAQPKEIREELLEFLRTESPESLLGESAATAKGKAAVKNWDRIRRRVRVEPVLEKGGVHIHVTGRTAPRAKWLAETLVIAYRNHLAAGEIERRETALANRKTQLARQEDRVKALREAILSFNRMRLAAVDKYGGEERDDWRQALYLDQLNTRIGTLQDRLAKLSDLELEAFLEQANRMKLIDERLMEKMTTFFDHQGTVRSLDQSGLSKDHVEVVAAKERLEEARAKLEAGVSSLLEKLKQEIHAEQEKRASLLSDRDETWGLLQESSTRLEETRGLYEEETALLADTQAELYRADECFCTGTMGELVPVGEVDGRPIGNGERPVLETVQGHFRELTRNSGTPVV